MDASKIGEDYKDSNGNKKHRITDAEVNQIVETFRNCQAVKDFSVAVTYEEIIEKKYSLSAGQYFDVEIEYVDITAQEFNQRMADFQKSLQEKFAQGQKLEKSILEQLGKLEFKG